MGRSQINDVLPRLAMPSHAGLFQSLIEDHFATSFRDPTADRITAFLSLRKVHVGSILLQVVQSPVVVLLRSFHAISTFLLSSPGDDLVHRVVFVT